jgi:serine protease Do
MRFSQVLVTIILIVVINILFLYVGNVFTKQKALTDTPAEMINIDDPISTPPSGTSSETESSYFQRSKKNEAYQVGRHNSVTETVKNSEMAVVSVNVIKTQIVRRNTNPFENPFFGFFDYRPYRREVQSIGSGIIYNQEGYIITNSHVVEGATQIKIILSDQRQFEAKFIGSDSILDIAVLKIDVDNLQAAKLGRSSDLLLGETVIAIGNPYAFLIKDSKPSVSVGVISAMDRNFAQDSGGKIYQRMIQTDAAINPGNSGGPLINILGEVIGINTFIFSESGGSIGIGFAIPIDRIKNIANEIIDYGRRRQIWFGLKIQELNPMIASYLGLEDLNGVIVSVVEPNSPSANAGLQRGDIIKVINGNTINSTEDAEVAISEITVGDKIEFKVLRGKKTITIMFSAVELNSK